MRALISRATGGPDSLAMGELPEPEPAPGQVVVRVAACGINFPDALMIEDRYQFRPPRPFAPGAEIAGTVIKAAPDVTWPLPGSRVMGMCGSGGLAEQAVLAASQCVAMPDAMPFADGAAFMMTYGTAYHALVQRGRIIAGETLLVLGAAGGVGLAAVQIGKALGAIVVAAVSDAAKLETALEHGADRGFVYPARFDETTDTRTLAALVKAQVGTDGADVILDPVGGPLTEASVRTLAWNGRLLVVGFPAGIAKLPLNLLLLKGASAVGVFYGVFAERDAETNRLNNEALLDMYARGAVRPLVSGRYPLEAGGAAIAELVQRKALGKLVVVLEEAAI